MSSKFTSLSDFLHRETLDEEVDITYVYLPTRAGVTAALSEKTMTVRDLLDRLDATDRRLAELERARANIVGLLTGAPKEDMYCAPSLKL